MKLDNFRALIFIFIFIFILEIDLQSHPGINSKARPTHYHVLYDENNFNSDLIQSLTYHLCYLSATLVNIFIKYHNHLLISIYITSFIFL
jgi:hypothetical protein